MSTDPRAPRALSGAPVAGAWRAPERAPIAGRTASLEPLDAARHLDELFAASHGVPGSEALWDYLPYGPFADPGEMGPWLEGCEGSEDPLFFAFRLASEGRVGGMGSMMRIEPAHGVAEIGHIWMGPALQRTTAATEALYLMMRHILDDLGYRRLEWKCNALNDASRAAALRLGFRFEGIFHQHLVVKGCNRDTAWYSLLDHEWPAVRAAFERWLAPSNFDETGAQRSPLDARAAES